ncbi:hypothetical protein D3C79_602850 [compost metagenome]
MAGLNQYAVTQFQFAQQDPLALAGSPQTQARGWQQVNQLRGGGGSAFAGAALQVTPGQQEQGEHADSIEVQLAAACDRCPDTGNVGKANSQRHRDVHGQVACAQVTGGAAEKRRTTVEDDGCGQKQRDPAQNGM